MDKKQTNAKAQRNSNVEILRIVAMLMIVASHYSFHGVGDSCQMANAFNFLFLKVITLGNLGVNIFILLFGYYSISAERLEWRRGFLLWFQVFTYSVLIFIGLSLFGIIEFSFGAFFRSLFPTMFSKYWFFTTYIIFFLLTPFFNKMLNLLSQKEYKVLLGIMLTLWCVIPTVTYQVPFCNDFTLFLLLYTLGGYFKLYPANKWNSKKCGLIFACVSSLFLFGSSFIFFFLGKLHPFFEKRETFFYHKNSAFVILLALGLLIVALHVKPRYHKRLNGISACTFGVYLLHDNDLIREFIWQDILFTQKMADSAFLVIHCLASVMTVFLAGVLIESIRKLTLEKIGIFCWERIEKTKNKR